MTDKQIIDRVNVKECKYYCNGKCERYEEFVEADYADYSVKCICENENVLGTYDICDYQQLKRKEQELEAYKMEAEEGKEINAELKATNEDLLSIQYKLADNNKRLRQAIEKIKEIAKNVIKNVSDRCIETTPMYGVHKQILQICDEVISE